jgi:ATP-dependent protease ClpP protease subunit
MRNRDLIENKFEIRMEGDSAEIMIYGVISNNKYQNEDVTASDFDKALKGLKGAKKATVRINSPGGQVFQAAAMRSMLMGAGFAELEVRIDGLCASAATLLACVPGAKVTMSDGGMYMIHNPWSLAIGEAKDLEHEAALLRDLEDTYRGIYAERSGRAPDEVQAWMNNETWFTAKKALDAGFVDEIGQPAAAAALAGARTIAAMRAMYTNVPDELDAAAPDEGEQDEGKQDELTSESEGEQEMEIKDITLGALQAENPALFGEIQAAAVKAERERLDEIDALTLPGYGDMAAQAKADGLSAMEFQKQIVAAQRQKGKDFLTARKAETEPAAEIRGDASEGTKADKSPEALGKEIAAEAPAVAGGGGMF